MLSRKRFSRLLTVVLLIIAAGLSLIVAKCYLVSVAQAPVAATSPCGETAAISDVIVTDVTSTTAVVSWQTSPAAASCLHLDSPIYPVFPSPEPITQTMQGITYAPGEYNAYLAWMDHDLVPDMIVEDVRAIASANFNVIVLYPTGPATLTIDSWDQSVLDVAVEQGLQVAFRLEWYEKSTFDWGSEDCDAILNHYDAYLAYFKENPDHLLYFVINMPLDDPDLLDSHPTLGQQRDYVKYCYDKIRERVPGATVYANTYYGWRDELHQAPVGDLVDGVSVVIYAQHAHGTPFDCSVAPTADNPAATLICKDQFDYYLDKAWVENDLADLDKPLVLDQTGFAPVLDYRCYPYMLFLPLVMRSTGLAVDIPYDHLDQGNGIVCGSWAKVRAIAVLRHYLEQDDRLYGWSYFKLLHKDEAAWGLIDRRRITDTVTMTHRLTLTDLFPSTSYTLSLQAGDATSGSYTFTTSVPPTETNVSPLLTIAGPPYGHELVPSGGQLTIPWRDDDPDDDARLGLYYDEDDNGCDGAEIKPELVEDNSTDFYTWTLPMTLPTGSYYIYGQIDDGANPTECDYSPGRFVPSTETLEVIPINGTIAVDGVMGESAWHSAIPLTYAIHISQTDVTTAVARALWNEDYLYVGVEVKDAQVETAASDWNDDSVSVIFNNGEFRCRQDVGGTGEGECVRGLDLPLCTTLDITGDVDCGYTVEMRIQWSEARITANSGDVVPTDLLSVDHDGNPGAPYTDTEFSKVSWDGDSSVDTTGRSITLIDHRGRWPCILLPAALQAWPKSKTEIGCPQVSHSLNLW